MTTVPCFQVDAFTDRPFAGNPAAVCLLMEDYETDWMQSVALEMNLSETAFVRPLEKGFELRWFTPAVEVDLCGHATLATAHVLWSEEVTGDSSIVFHTKSGALTATRNRELIELDFPSTPPTEVDPPEGLVEALGATPIFVGRSAYDKFLVLSSEEEVRALKPDFRLLAQVPARGVIVTSQSSDSRFDFVSRFFAPASGVDEDPVTGSAHCCLAPFWSERLGKREMTGYQASARGGVVQVRVKGDRVILAGRSVTVFRGELLVV